ncbi:hypothetical protein RIF29_00632 [Crotalaria pallida]|uniref:Uncharacterized protein n=1 Tax=Crotalaria pallida TaxID=3830 RepID=A0AAN9P6N8_CROPI
MEDGDRRVEVETNGREKRVAVANLFWLREGGSRLRIENGEEGKRRWGREKAFELVKGQWKKEGRMIYEEQWSSDGIEEGLLIRRRELEKDNL